MSHFARIDENNVVVEVIVAEQNFIDILDNKEDWVQTSRNTIGGVHLNGGTPLRKNYAGLGYTYDKTRDAFIPPKPYESWVLNEDSCLWEAPVICPNKPSCIYDWDEDNTQWIETFVEEESA